MSSVVFDIVEKVAATSSKNEKEQILSENSANVTLARALQYGYCPFKTYGIANIPSVGVASGGVDFDEKTWNLLDRLISRELTGNCARESVATELSRLSMKSSELLRRIIRKDFRAGFSESTINKVWKGKIKDFPYMRCCLVKDVKLAEWPWDDGVFSQEKADGMFANVDHEISGVVRITSRQGSEFPIERFGSLVQEIEVRLNKDTQSHGEIIIKRGDEVLERQIGNGILNSVLNGGDFGEGERPVFLMWDQIPLPSVVSKGKYQVPYRVRLTSILHQLHAVAGDQIQLIPTKIVKSLPDAMLHYRELLAQGKEGTVIKHPGAIWRDGNSKEQVKLKLEVDVDLKIVAIVPGRDGTKNEGRPGSVTCVTSDELLRVDVTVKNDKMRDEIEANPGDWLERIIVVRANGILKPSESNALHSLFLPRMVETSYRTDKSEADSLQRVFDQFESAIAG